jgi:hypothetical protein
MKGGRGEIQHCTPVLFNPLCPFNSTSSFMVEWLCACDWLTE